MAPHSREALADDEIRQLATAIVALADAQHETVAALREENASRGETNRILASIHDQNEQILEQMKLSNDRHSTSERKLRAHEQKLTVHTEHLVTIGEALGIPYPGAQ